MKLKPCPLCGGKASVVKNQSGSYYVWCGTEETDKDGCGLRLHNPRGVEFNFIAGWNTRANAITAWNRRDHLFQLKIRNMVSREYWRWR